MNELPKRKHPRLCNYDYSSAGAYFVTICTHNRKCLLSHIVGREFAPAEIQYTELGMIAKQQLLNLTKRYSHIHIDYSVVMPNHIHILIRMDDYPAGASARPTLSDVICTYKSLTTRECKQLYPIDKLFQTSFYEHVIRGDADYQEIAEYIINNPKQWELDQLYCKD